MWQTPGRYPKNKKFWSDRQAAFYPAEEWPTRRRQAHWEDRKCTWIDRTYGETTRRFTVRAVGPTRNAEANFLKKIV